MAAQGFTLCEQNVAYMTERDLRLGVVQNLLARCFLAVPSPDHSDGTRAKFDNQHNLMQM